MQKTIAFLTVLFLLPCSYAAQPPATYKNCSELAGLPEGNLLLFGEMHGSIEAPELISQVACSVSKHHKVAVGLEIPLSEQRLIDAYLASHGTRADERKLTDSQFWQTDHDGRSSTAMLGLIEAIRILKRSGRSIDLFAFDEQPGTDLERDVAIARGIRRFHSAHPNTKVIALMGNIHAMQDPMTVDGGKLLPSGYLLRDLDPVSILIAYPKGTTWACMPDCRIHVLSPKEPVTGPSGFREGATLSGYSHMFLLNSITASKPAVTRNAHIDTSSFESELLGRFRESDRDVRVILESSYNHVLAKTNIRPVEPTGDQLVCRYLPLNRFLHFLHTREIVFPQPTQFRTIGGVGFQKITKLLSEVLAELGLPAKEWSDFVEIKKASCHDFCIRKGHASLPLPLSLVVRRP